MLFRMAANALEIVGTFDHLNVLDVGSMGAIICGYCGAKRWKAEPDGMCCRSGRVVLPPLEKPPDLLHNLITKVDPRGTHFLQHVREYNSAHNMVSSSARAEKPFPDGIQAFQPRGPDF